jgi:hypothetical protein
MDKMLRKVLSGIVLLVVLLSASFVTTQAATDEEIFAAIELGVPWLAGQQYPGGYWSDPWYGEPIASTGFAVLKLLEYAYENGIDPFDPDYAYNSQVEAGLAYLWGEAEVSDCAGIVFGKGHHETYSTGVAMMAIAATQTPDFVLGHPNPVVNGLSVLQVVQGAVDHFVCAQNPDGGWRYWFNDEPSDNSNTGYAVLGLRYAEEFGVPIPESLKTELSGFIDLIQDDVDGDDNDGGSWYTPDWDWVNVLKTGNLLFEMAFVGDAVTDQRVQDALDYIERHWNDMNNDPGWRGHNQAMYCLMKGFGAFGIEEIEIGGAPVDWFQDFADDLLDRQDVDGSWPGENWGGPVLATEWALLTLEKIAPPPVEIEVPVDIKPTSCRNPINTKDKGVQPVAILGTEDFDVTQVDPATVLLMGVAPLRWAYEDVATPYEPYIGKEGAFACTTEGPDGYLDLVFHFDTQELVEALGEVADGDVIVIPLTGNLSEEFGGTPIVGEDVVVILKKGKK